jgi:type IV pilus assembly protein PilM
MARNCIGLDIGSTAIKLVQLRHGRNGLVLENFGVEPVPAAAIAAGAVVEPGAVVAALRTLVQRIGLRGKEVALAVSGNGVIIKRISVPQLEPAAFAQQIEWEARQLVAPPSRDDVLIDHTRLRQNPVTGEVEVLLVAAKKDLVSQYLRVVGEAGLRPVVVDATAFALQNCVEACQGFTGGETFAVVNVGATASTISIIAEGMPAYGRDISSGGNLYTEALRGVGLDAAAAERFKRGAEPPTGADPAPLRRVILQVSESIAAEIQRSLDFFRGMVAEEPLSRIVLTGGSALVPALRQALAVRSRLPVTVLEPFARVQVDARVELAALRANAPAAAVAFGLALRQEDDAP